MKIEEIGAIVMASGFSVRMGQNKLLMPVAGQSMYRHVLDMLEKSRLQRICVVTPYDAIAEDAAARGMQTVCNSAPQLGQSHSVVLGVQACADCRGWMFFSADQPFLKSSTVDAMAAAAAGGGYPILAASCRGRRGQPVYFDGMFKEALLKLSGDAGGRSIMKSCPEQVHLFEVEDEREMLDLDTPEDIGRL